MASLNGTRRVHLFALLILVAIYFLVGFYPFHWQTPPDNQPDNGATRSPDGGISFPAPGIAYTEQAPSWLKDAISTSRLEVSLVVRSADPKQYGPARIFTLSPDRFHRNFTIAQWGDRLIVRMRSPDTDVNGKPSYIVDNVFVDTNQHRIDVRIQPAAIEIRVDGDTAISAALQDRPLEDWEPDYRLGLGNELSGDRPWLGAIQKAVVRVGDSSFDYLAPAALRIPERFTLKNYHAWKVVPFVDEPYPGNAARDWAINLLGFVPFGWLVVMLRRPGPGILLAIVLSAGVSATIEVGQLLVFAERFPATQDIIMNTLGGALGAWLARRSA